MTTQKSRLDMHEMVTNKIIAAIEAGAGEWKMPWHRPGTSFSIPHNATTDKPYRGINVLSLWIDADARRVDQALTNLLENANASTAVHVFIDADRDSIVVPGIVRLHVCDDGPGVPAEIRDRLFEQILGGSVTIMGDTMIEEIDIHNASKPNGPDSRL